MMKWTTQGQLCALIAAVVWVCSSVTGQAAVTVQDLASTSVPHENGGLVAMAGQIYLWDGFTTGGARSDQLEIYNPQTNTWSAGATCPVSRSGLGSFGLNGQAYLLGGEGTSSGSFNDDAWRYDPGSDSWQGLNSLPRNAWDPQTAVVNNTAYFFGGRAGYGTTYSDMYRYDATADTWQACSNMPTSVVYAGTAAVGGEIYAFGGDNVTVDAGDQYVNTIQVYDPTSDSWSSPGTMPVTLNRIKAVVYNGDVFLFAPSVLDTTSGTWQTNDKLYRYDPQTQGWSSFDVTYPSSVQFYNPVALIDGYAYFADDNGVGTGFYRINLSAVPEPASLSLAVLGCLGLLRRRRLC